MNSPSKLLLVDDTPANLALLIEYFAKRDFQLFVAESGPSALDRLRHVQPDLILLDILMPGMNGFEVCKAIKANPQTRHIPVIFLTARDETSDKLKGFTVGGVDYITKPLVEAEVLARVRTHLQLAQREHRLSTENFQLHQQLIRRAAAAMPQTDTKALSPQTGAAPMLRLTLFDSFQLSIGDEVRTEFRSDLVRALLAYLVLEGQSRLHRTHLAEFFWPTYLAHTRLNSLRVALHNLRQLLKPLDYLLVTDRKTVRFQAESPHVWCDALVLDRDTAPVLTASGGYPAHVTAGRPVGFLRGFHEIDSSAFQQWRWQRQAQYAIYTQSQK